MTLPVLSLMESAFLFHSITSPMPSCPTLSLKRFSRALFMSALLVCGAPTIVSAQTLPESVTITAADYTETLTREGFASWFHLETTLVPSSRLSEATDTLYCPVSALYCDLSLSRHTRDRLAVTFEREANPEAIATFIAMLGDQVNQDPVDAVFGVADNASVVVTAPEKLGRTLQASESAQAIVSALQNADGGALSITLPTITVTPKIVAADRERLGLKELIGEGKSNFKGSPKNRVFNIKRALLQFQNVIIAPGEEFSFVDYLGDVDGEHGYLPELVIKNNQTTPEFGGGICQVSSTVFRAAIYSGLKITERRNHAYAVQYYKPIGMDATIYIPRPDLKFKNDTPGAILMQSTIEGDDLTFRFFGTRDGRTVKVDGPHVLSRGGDGSMKTVFTQEVNDASGQNYLRDSFYSNYKSPALFPHPGQEPVYTTKPTGWSEKQWKDYRAAH